MVTRQALPPAVESALLNAIELAVPLLRPGAASVESLAQLLYSDWYIAVRTPKALQLDANAPPFLSMLRASHGGSWRWESGWRAERVSTAGRVQAVRNDERRLLGITEYVSDHRPGLPPRPGTGIAAVARRDSTHFMPGFWFTHTGRWSLLQGPRVRLYWNVTPAGAPGLVRQITQHFGEDVSYALKLPIEPALFARSDPAVLYLDEQAFEAVRSDIRRVHDVVARDLANDVPKLTHRLASGLGLAEDSGNTRESFGTSRCLLLSEALITASRNGRRTQRALLGAVVRRFAEAGIPAAMPHLRDWGHREYAI
jgi:HopA1 effector protein family